MPEYLKSLIDKIKTNIANINTLLIDDVIRFKIQCVFVYIMLICVSAFMTIVNIITAKYTLMISTAVFCLLCLINLLLANKGDKYLNISSWLFTAELIVLLTFFIISGTPEGFSSIWACLVPASGLLLFGRKRGSVICLIMFIVIVFCFETPIGRSLLQYQYTESFMLRFPMLYSAFYAVSFMLETIRATTNAELLRTREKYEYLYIHDSLTGLYNRYGFNENMDKLFEKPLADESAFILLDIDHFKRVNDVYGHLNGDAVLVATAQTIKKHTGDSSDVCRWGGEEFAVLCRDGKNARKFADNILNSFRRNSIKTADADIKITVSIGLVLIPPNTKINAAALVLQADNNMYMAKKSGRDIIISDRYISVFDKEKKQTE